MNNISNDLNFCIDDCEYLSLTEKEQDDLGAEGKKLIHKCEYFNKRVYHGAYHPRLFNIIGCPKRQN